MAGKESSPAAEVAPPRRPAACIAPRNPSEPPPTPLPLPPMDWSSTSSLWDIDIPVPGFGFRTGVIGFGIGVDVVVGHRAGPTSSYVPLNCDRYKQGWRIKADWR